MTEAPKVIWLQIDPDGEGFGDWSPEEGATWCWDQINDTDVKYVRPSAMTCAEALFLITKVARWAESGGTIE